MSDLTAILAGLGIGLLVTGPVLFVYRHELRQRIGDMFRDPSDGRPRGENVSDLPGLSPMSMTVVFVVALASVVYGAIQGVTVFVVTGLFISVFTTLVILLTKVRR